MARKRLSMRKIRKVLRLRYDLRLSARQIAKSCNIARSTVSDYLFRARNAGLCWPLPPELDDTALENLLYPPAAQDVPQEKCQMPPIGYITSNYTFTDALPGSPVHNAHKINLKGDSMRKKRGAS